MTRTAPPTKTQSASQKRKATEELRVLKANLSDLQAKRISALRLYQEEKTLRQKVEARFKDISAEVTNLQSQPPTPTPHPLNVLHTTHFVAELRALGLVQSPPYISLTWHCLAMADCQLVPPEIFAILHPKEKSQPETFAYCPSNPTEPDNGRVINRSQEEPDPSPEVDALLVRLRRAEQEAEDAKRLARENEDLITNLKSQLDASTAACNDLVRTLEDHEDAIQQMS